jgi:hypothetical protein
MLRGKPVRGSGRTSPKGAHGPVQKKSDQIAVGRFEALLGKRRDDLVEERRKLDFSRGQLSDAIVELERANERIKQEEAELDRVEQDLQAKDANSLNSGPPPGGEATHRVRLLQKAEVDLRQNLQVAERELAGAMVSENFRREQDEATLLQMQKELEAKKIFVDSLRNLLNTLNTDILDRENEVLEAEIQAFAHREQVRKAEQEKRELARRKIAAEAANERLMAEIQEREQANHKFLVDSEDIATQFESAQRERDRLVLLEEQIAKRESELDQKQADLAAEVQKFNELRLARAQEELQAKLGHKKADPEKGEVPQEEEDLYELEVKLDQEERALNERSQLLAVERTSAEAAWEAKERNLDRLITDLKRELSESPSVEDLEAQIAQTKEESAKLPAEIERKLEENRALEGELRSDDDIAKENAEIDAEMKRVKAIEQELDDELERLRQEEEGLKAQEEEAAAERASLANEQKQLEESIEQTRNLIETYKAQLKTAQQTHISLTRSLQELTASKGPD